MTDAFDLGFRKFKKYDVWVRGVEQPIQIEVTWWTDEFVQGKNNGRKINIRVDDIVATREASWF